MASPGMLRRVDLVRTYVSEELSTSNIRVINGELVPILVTLMTLEALSSSEMSVVTRTPRRNIPENAILLSHRRENLKSYSRLVCFLREIDNLDDVIVDGAEL
jgi:hypothetical protein